MLTVERDVKAEYWAADWLRAYGRTKLAGEAAIRASARHVEYVIVRPTVVVDVQDLLQLGDWGRGRKYLFANRHAHHVFMPDVADALIWLTARALARDHPQPGVSTFILGEDDATHPTYKAFFDQAYSATRDPRFRVPDTPWQLDWMRAFAQARTLPLRTTFGRMQFSGEKLRAEGWRPSVGMDRAIERALDEMRDRGAPGGDAGQP